MAVTVKNVVCCLALLSLCFVGIPVRIKEPDAVEQEFLEFIQKHNKSYVNEPAEYAKRLEYFKVALLSYLLILQITSTFSCLFVL